MANVRVPVAPAEYDVRHQDGVATSIVQLDNTALKKAQRNFINGNSKTEIVLIDANGAKWKLGVDTSGNLTTTAVT